MPVTMSARFNGGGESLSTEPRSLQLVKACRIGFSRRNCFSDRMARRSEVPQMWPSTVSEACWCKAGKEAMCRTLQWNREDQVAKLQVTDNGGWKDFERRNSLWG